MLQDLHAFMLWPRLPLTDIVVIGLTQLKPLILTMKSGELLALGLAQVRVIVHVGVICVMAYTACRMYCICRILAA